MIQRHKSKIKPGFLISVSGIVSKIQHCKFTSLASRAFDLRSALGPAATFHYNKCKKEIKV